MKTAEEWILVSHNLIVLFTESDLRVRSLVIKSNREYECVASDPSGPIITWSLYHKQTDSWENLDTSGDDYTIQSVNVSTCVVRSTLVMSSSQVSPTAVACTAQAQSNNSTALIYKGNYQNVLLLKDIIDVKFASGIKNINFGFYPYTDVC